MTAEQLRIILNDTSPPSGSTREAWRAWLTMRALLMTTYPEAAKQLSSTEGKTFAKECWAWLQEQGVV